VPNHLYDGQLSIYNIGQQAFGGPSASSSISGPSRRSSTSNHLSYSRRILPEGRRNSKPRLDYRVEADFVTRKKVNLKEADHIAALMIACTNMPEYEEKTFGVVSMVGEEQALHVERLLRGRMPLAEYLGRRISCGNSANFQGDERDVMFLSMVDCRVRNRSLIRRQRCSSSDTSRRIPSQGPNVGGPFARSGHRPETG
jgi:superfamily I DNA and/or RNA helicase